MVASVQQLQQSRAVRVTRQQQACFSGCSSRCRSRHGSEEEIERGGSQILNAACMSQGSHAMCKSITWSTTELSAHSFRTGSKNSMLWLFGIC